LFLASLLVFNSSNLSAQRRDSRINPGKWLGDRGPFDPRPFDRTHLFDGLLLDSGYFGWKNQLWEEKGFSFGGYFSINSQIGGQDKSNHNMSEFLFTGAWELQRNDNRAGRIIYGFAHDQTFGSLTTREFADGQRIVEAPNDLDTHPERTFTTLGLLLWEQEFRLGSDWGWGFRAGQFFAAPYFGLTYFLDDDRRFFLARPLAAAAGAQWVGFNDIGLGGNVVVWKSPFYVSAAVLDGKANRKFPDFKSIKDGRLLYIGGFGYETNLGGPDETAIRLTFSHLDLPGENPDKGRGQSVMFSGERKFKGRWAVFGRWSKSYKRFESDYRELISIGVSWTNPLGFSDDFLGIGFFSGRPSDPAKSTESGFELCYKLVLTQGLNLMPDLQYWTRKDTGIEQVKTWIGGIRLNVEY
jgi:hypothetical protein